MGLHVSHDCWTGAYSAFSRWRNKIAEVTGYGLMDPTPEEQAEGHYGKYPALEWSGIEERNFFGEWDRTPPDPLVVLFAHSDCEGVIKPAQAEPLLKRLEQILPLMPDEPAPGHIGNWREKTQTFIDGLREAVALDEEVQFA